eukprot:1412059-Rhodomonas_salina.1
MIKLHTTPNPETKTHNKRESTPHPQDKGKVQRVSDQPGRAMKSTWVRPVMLLFVYLPELCSLVVAQPMLVPDIA